MAEQLGEGQGLANGESLNWVTNEGWFYARTDWGLGTRTGFGCSEDLRRGSSGRYWRNHDAIREFAFERNELLFRNLCVQSSDTVPIVSVSNNRDRRLPIDYSTSRSFLPSHLS